MNYFWKGEVSLRSDASLRLLANTAVHAGPANELKVYFINKKSLKRATMSKDKCDPGCLLPFWPPAVKLVQLWNFFCFIVCGVGNPSSFF